MKSDEQLVPCACVVIDSEYVMPGWGCCRCKGYNGDLSDSCRICGHTNGTPDLSSDLVTCNEVYDGPSKPDLHGEKCYLRKVHTKAPSWKARKHRSQSCNWFSAEQKKEQDVTGAVNADGRVGDVKS